MMAVTPSGAARTVRIATEQRIRFDAVATLVQQRRGRLLLAVGRRRAVERRRWHRTVEWRRNVIAGVLLVPLRGLMMVMRLMADGRWSGHGRRHRVRVGGLVGGPMQRRTLHVTGRRGRGAAAAASAAATVRIEAVQVYCIACWSSVVVCVCVVRGSFAQLNGVNVIY